MKPINVPSDFRSDGCTFPFGPLSNFLKYIMNSGRHDHLACVEHDFLRRHDVVPFYKADILLGKRIWKCGFHGKLQAPFYVLFTMSTYWYAKKYHRPLDKVTWEPYAQYYKEWLDA